MVTMEALICTQCGAILTPEPGGESATCQSCGTHYNKRQIRSLIEDAVLTRLLKNAETFYSLGDFKKSLELYKKIIDEFPERPEGWEKSLDIVTELWVDFSGNKICGYSIKGDVLSIRRYCKNLEQLSGDSSFSGKYRDSVYRRICSGELYVDGLFENLDDFSGFLTDEQISFIKEQAQKNAEAVNKLKLISELADLGAYQSAEMTVCTGYIGSMIACTRRIMNPDKVYSLSDGTTQKAKAVADGNDLATRLTEFRRKTKVCLHCGGTFKFRGPITSDGIFSFNGFFDKVCSVCGKPKDY